MNSIVYILRGLRFQFSSSPIDAEENWEGENWEEEYWEGGNWEEEYWEEENWDLEEVP